MADPRGHVRIPDWLLTRPDVKPEAKVVWAVFHRLQNGSAVSYPSYETVARMAGMSRQRVLRLVDYLEAKALLEIRLVSFTGSEVNLHGFRSNLFITHDGKSHFPTREQQRNARQIEAKQASA